jgi:hypothetical protein
MVMKLMVRVNPVAGFLFGYKAWIQIPMRRRDGIYLPQTKGLFG